MLPLLVTIALAGAFSLRALLPAFLAALAMRLAPELLPWTHAWLTGTGALVILGALAALEIALHRSQDARDVVRRVQPLLGGAAVIAIAGSAAAAVAVALAALLRSRALGILAEIDDEDDLHVQGLIAWVEDAWVLVVCAGVALAPPGVAAMLGAMAPAGIGVLWWAVRRIDRAGLRPCAVCGAPLHPGALACPRCGAPQVARRVGLLGFPRAGPVTDVEAHRQQLVEAHRCPSCATRLPSAPAPVTCAACGTRVLEPALAGAYLRRIDRRLPRVLAICALVGLVPVAGAVAGIAYHRLVLVAPLRRYLPVRRRVPTGWALAAAYLALAGLQVVPVAGALTVPAMAALAYQAYRSQLRAHLGLRNSTAGPGAV